MAEGFGDLPTEILLLIMSYLNAKDLARSCNVSYHWRRVGEDNSLWKRLFIKNFKPPRSIVFKSAICWIDEYKMLKLESPSVLTENLQDCVDGLLHVTFSNSGHLFCTVANDTSFKIWTARSPIYLMDERRMDEVLGWEQTRQTEFSPDDRRLLVTGLKHGDVAEIAIYDIDEENVTIHYACRVTNNPVEIGACWYNSTHIFSGDVYRFSINSTIGSSISQMWICSALPATYVSNQVIMCTIFRLLNRGGSFTQMVKLSRFVPSRFRGILLLAEKAALEHKTLASKASELLDDADSSDEAERRNQLRQRIDSLSDAICPCSACCDQCTRSSTTDSNDENLWYLPSQVTIGDCECDCHESGHRLLIYAIGNRADKPPHQIAFKIIEHDLVFKKLFPFDDATQSASDPQQITKQEATSETNQIDHLTTLLSMVDLPDYVIEMNAHVMHFTLSANHKFLFVNVTHDNYDVDSNYNFLAELRVINLSTMLIESSYFGHFATITDRLACSVGGQYLASASLDGARVWSGEYRCVLGDLPHMGGAAAVALNPRDGSIAVSVGRIDGRIKVWKSKQWKLQSCEQQSQNNYRDFDIF